MFTSIWFIVTSIAALAGIMLFPRNKKKENGVLQTAACVMALLTYWVLAAGLIQILGLPVNIGNLSWSNLLIALLACFVIIKKRRVQKYYFSWKDAVVIGSIFAITILLGVVRYGVHIDVFAYSQDDSVRHFYYASSLAQTGQLQGRYTLYLINMIFIQVLDPVIGAVNWYRAFLISELFLFLAIGVLFWVLIRTYIKDRYSWVAGIVMEYLFLFGYPLLNMLCGFEYLGSGMLVCIWLLWILYKIEQKDRENFADIILLMNANLAMCNSYTLFAPAMLLGELVYLIVLQNTRKKFYSWYTLFLFLLGFLIPGILCVWFVTPDYMKMLLPLLAAGLAVLGVLLWANRLKFFRRHNRIRVFLWTAGISAACYFVFRYVLMDVVVNYLSTDGSIYREPYGNVLFWVFPVVLFVLRNIRKKHLDAGLSIMSCVLVFAVWMLYCVSTGEMGTYYFYKLHFLMWVLVYWCAFREIATAMGAEKRYLTTYLMIGLTGFCIFLTGFEKNLHEKQEYMWPSNLSAGIFGVYQENIDSIQAGGNVTRDMQTMYNHVREVVDEQDTFVPYFGVELRYLKEYYYYLSNQNPSWHPEHLNNADYPSFDIMEDLEKLGCKYIFVEKGYGGTYEEYKPVFDWFPVRFENDYGWLLKVE